MVSGAIEGFSFSGVLTVSAVPDQILGSSGLSAVDGTGLASGSGFS